MEPKAIGIQSQGIVSQELSQHQGKHQDAGPGGGKPVAPAQPPPHRHGGKNPQIQRQGEEPLLPAVAQPHHLRIIGTQSRQEKQNRQSPGHGQGPGLPPGKVGAAGQGRQAAQQKQAGGRQKHLVLRPDKVGVSRRRRPEDEGGEHKHGVQPGPFFRTVAAEQRAHSGKSSSQPR